MSIRLVDNFRLYLKDLNGGVDSELMHLKIIDCVLVVSAGHWLFTNLLLGKMKRSAESGIQGRIVNVASSFQLTYKGGIRFDSLNEKGGWVLTSLRLFRRFYASWSCRIVCSINIATNISSGWPDALFRSGIAHTTPTVNQKLRTSFMPRSCPLNWRYIEKSQFLWMLGEDLEFTFWLDRKAHIWDDCDAEIRG